MSGHRAPRQTQTQTTLLSSRIFQVSKVIYQLAEGRGWISLWVKLVLYYIYVPTSLLANSLPLLFVQKKMKTIQMSIKSRQVPH
jgi:ABC-type microcin C transport system permease subunit YejE